MTLPTPVNSQITDAVTQANVNVLADAPAMALSNLYQIVSSSLGLSLQNATSAQQQSNIVHQASTTQGVNLIYAVDTEAVADGTEKISRADIPSDMLDVLGVVKSLNRKQPSSIVG
ncbi:RebB family R body protein [Candidatus Finniella inopinata]|uniref:RebB like protein n=1 Tax=Candidatus Finniella inopinata TaxID=1696036 RepID=A0A4Q7DI32_9PROT|nr:RebB family R body protein [Candidatus Finniella inopinata]RZI46621.1 RebB like protein [Candidatus Finniella inopinata]